MGNNGNTKIYYGKKSKGLKIYIICFVTSIILGCIIKGDISIYLIVIPILTIPLLILLVKDTNEANKFRIKLDNEKIKIKNKNKKSKWRKNRNRI